MIRRQLLTLLLVIIPCLVMTQTTNGQTFTNNTVTIATSLATSTQLRSQPIFPIPPQVGTITIPPTHGVCGVYFVQAFNATAGDVISGIVRANNAVNLYILHETGFKAWSNRILGGGVCTPARSLLDNENTASYNFTVPIPTDDQYELILHNLSTASIVANLNINRETSALVTMTRYSTITAVSQSSIQTIFQSSLQTSVQAAATTSQSNWVWAALIIIVILAIISYLITKRKRRESSRSKN